MHKIINILPKIIISPPPSSSSYPRAGSVEVPDLVPQVSQLQAEKRLCSNLKTKTTGLYRHLR